jgi:RimJ/RimL family protein N-acetyltransferase
MNKISLRKIELSDKKYFANWWRDKELLELTSGHIGNISDTEVDEYFNGMINNTDYHYMVSVEDKTIGHISLIKHDNIWHEIQIVIGEKEYWGKGYGTEAIKLMINKAKILNITKIFLEVRPTNTRAIKAYEKCGYRIIRTVYYPDNVQLPQTLRMELYDL